MLYTSSTALSTVQHLRTFPSSESWTSTLSRRRAKKELWDLFRVCKENIYLRLLPFKHLLNSTFYRKICITEGKLKKSQSQRQLTVSWAALKVLLEEWVLLSTSEAAPGTLWTYWKEPSEGHKHDEGSGALHIWGKADWAGTVLPGKGKAPGILINVYKTYTMQRGQRQPVSSGGQWQDRRQWA